MRTLASTRPQLFALAGIAIAVVLGGFALAAGGPTALDSAVTSSVIGSRTESLTTVMLGVTFLGSTAFLLPASILSVIVLASRGHRMLARTFAFTMLASAAVTVTVKLAIGRPRPPANLEIGAPNLGYSFPSGHTLNSAVFLALWVFATYCLRKSTRVRDFAEIAALVTGLLIGFSRIYLGYHWLTDVLAGWAIATAVFAVTLVRLNQVSWSRRRHS